MQAIILALGLLAQQAAVIPDGQAVEPAPAPQLTPEPVSDFAVSILGQLPSTLDDVQGGVPGRSVQLFAMAGREDLVQRFRPQAYEALSSCPILTNEGLDPLIQAARSAQIVIINETHHQPLHRQMIARLGELLADDFDVFAAETFNYLRLQQPLPERPVGYFAQEPIFARQLTLLDDAGYRFVAYEARAAQRALAGSSLEAALAARNEAQADNLIAAVLEDDPGARIIIHVGLNQVLEAPLSAEAGVDPVRGFAYRLKQKTGIDPLTISQVHCAMPDPVEGAAGEGAAVGEARSEDQGVSAATTLAPPQPGTVFLADPAGALPDGALDLALVHAPMAFQDGRPVWRRAIGDTAVDVPVTLRPVDAPVIVEARAPESSLRSPPVERLLIYPGDPHPLLLLPQGRWVITAWSREGRVGEPVTVDMP